VVSNVQTWYEIIKGEKWRFGKILNGFGGKYQVSNFGRVKSLYCANHYKKTYREKVLKQTKNRWGYFFTNLSINNKHKLGVIHRLVAQTFIPNTENKPQVNHINRN